MKAGLIVKLNFLILALALTAYAIYVTETRGLPPSVLAFFGIRPPTAGAYKESWCDTRVEALIRPNEFKLSQQGDKWVRDNGESRLLNFIAVEKWFGRNCAVSAQKEAPLVATEQRADFSPALLVKFITGEVEPLRRSQDGRYLWRDRVFRSTKMDQALQELDELAGPRESMQHQPKTQ